MQRQGEKSWTNATHLVIVDDDHPQAGQHLTTTHLHNDSTASAMPIVVDASGALVAADRCDMATLLVNQQITLYDGRRVTVKSSFQRLKEAAEQMTLAAYSAQCGVPVAQIQQLAETFTGYGRKAAVITHGGMMAGNGFYNAWATMMLNVLIGNMNLSGGVFLGGGQFNGVSDGPRYNLVSFPGQVKPKGLNIARSNTAYETSDEYREKVAADVSPWPAKAP